MDQSSQPSAQGVPQDSGRWIGRVIVAVLAAEGIWGVLLAFTRYLILPFLARQMGGDPQSPLYLGKGDYNFPGIFGSILELCLAGIIAVIVNAWVNRGARQVRVVRVTRTAAPAASTVPSFSITPPAPAASVATPPPAAPVRPVPPPAAIAPPKPSVAPPPTPRPASPAPAPVAAPAPKPAAPPVAPPPAPKPEKPKAPKEVYYNIVGEPIEPDE